VTADEGYPSREDRIVAEFGDGHDVEGIAFRYGLTVAQVYAVVEREVGPVAQGSPGPPPAYHVPQPPVGHYYPPPAPQGSYLPPAPQGPYLPPAPQGYYPPPPHQVYYGPSAHPAPPPSAYAGPGPDFPPPQDEDAIVAEYGEGHDVNWIAHKHGITVERVYQVIQGVVGDDQPLE
jgi:hypothetical protein